MLKTGKGEVHVRVAFVMRRSFEFDFPELWVGSAEYEEGPTGCTLLHFPAGAQAAVDMRGGAVAGRELAGLSPMDGWSEVDGILFTGGSTFGLDSASGVMHGLLERRHGSTAFDDLPAIPTAAVYDFSGRENSVYPDAELGLQAFENAKSGHAYVGRVGAGRNVTVGSYFGESFAEKSGQGAAFVQVRGIKIFAFCVANACGHILNRDGQVIAGGRDPQTGKRFSAYERLYASLSGQAASERYARPAKNTVLSAVVTQVALDRLELLRVAVMAHAALARLVDPFHSPEDGDVVFACSTQSASCPGEVDVGDIGVLAGHALQDALFNAIDVT